MSSPGGPGVTDLVALSRLLRSHLACWPEVSSAGVVLGPGAVAKAGPSDEMFAWASVSKLLVAVAVWVAVEEGTVAWDDEAGPPGSTLAHLLSHASGLPFEGDRPIAPPGRRRGYSNTGIELAAAHLAAAAGMSFEEYAEGAVLGPLGMGRTKFHGPPAHGAVGPLDDLLSLAGELLAPALVSSATLARATAVAWPGLAGVLPGFGRQDPCDWGLGPEVRSHKSPHWTGRTNSASTYGHFGQTGSFLWVDPGPGVAVAGLSSQAFGAWAKQAWPALADAVLLAVRETAGEVPGGR